MTKLEQVEQTLAAKDSELSSVRRTVVTLERELREKQAQLDWMKKQLFGQRSEKQRYIDDVQQSLFTEDAPRTDAEDNTQGTTVAAHTRRKKKQRGNSVTDEGLRFDENVPVVDVEHRCDELDGADAQDYEIVRYDYVHKLASRPGSKVVLRHKYPVLKHKTQGHFVQPQAVEGVLGQSQIDVSALADMLVEKFVYHMPLYRQHQKLQDEGFQLSRSTLGNWVGAGIELLRPIADILRDELLGGRYLKLDETAIKAGRTKTGKGKGKMKSGWLWPMLGEFGDIVFNYSASRGKIVVDNLLKDFSGTLQTDGYEVYAKYTAEHENINHALCWSHTRRCFVKAESMHPTLVKQILAYIAVLYRIERQLRECGASNEQILSVRQRRSRRCVDKIYKWIDKQIQRVELTPKDPLRKALHYAKDREAGLRVFLEDAWVALDTNDLERSLRVIPMGRKNWLFCSSEVGADHVAIIQTLLATCRAHDIHPFHYLVDVLQRVAIHPMSRVHELTPRQWQKRFASDPLRSPLHYAQ